MVKGKICAAIAALGLMAGAAQAKDLEIGALFPMSGPNAVYGDVFRSGTDLAVAHINDTHMLKEPLKILYEDSQALPQPAVVAMTKLVDVEGVPYVLTAFTGVSKAISTLAQRNQVVAVNGGGVGPDLAKLGPYFWNVIPLVNFEVHGMVPYLAAHGMKKVALIYIDDPLGQSILDELKTTLPGVGGKLVAVMSVPASAQNFAAVAAKVRASGADAVYIASYGAQQLQIAKQLRDNGVKAQFASYSGFSVPDALKLPEAQGLLYTTQAVNLKADDPVTKLFAEDYAKAHPGKTPSAYVVNYYNAVLLYAQLAQALEKAGKPITGPNLLAEREAMKSFDLVGGRVTFAANGTLVAPIQVSKIEDGKGVPLDVVKAE